MIKYEGRVRVTVEEFYETLLQQICADINQTTGKELDLRSIRNGCRYRVKKKRGNKEMTSIIEVKKPIENRRVETSNTTNGRTYTMIYEMEPEDEGCTKVTYIQDDGKEKSSIFDQMKVNSTTRSRLRAFEQYIRKQSNEKK